MIKNTQMTDDLKKYDINWDMGYADAVARHLEWGNNGYLGMNKYHTIPGEYSIYFVYDAWDLPHIIKLVKMDNNGSKELWSITAIGKLHIDVPKKGIYNLNDIQKNILKKMIYNDNK